MVVIRLSNTFNYKFTYFRGSHFYRAAQAQIQEQLTKADATLNDYKSIDNALNFLQSVATNEQQKELDSITHFVEEQKDKLSKIIPDFEHSELNKKLQNPTANIENIEAFYNEFIIALNASRRGLEETKKRIKTIQRNVNNQSRQFSHYASDDYRFKLSNDIGSFIKRLTGQYRRGDIDDSSMSAKLQTIAIRTINQLGLVDKIASGADFIAISSMILTDLEQQAQKELDAYMERVNKDGATFEDLSDKIYEKIESSYLNGIKNNTPQTRIQKMLLDSLDNIEESVLTMPISNAKNILNLKSSISQAKNIVGKSSQKNKTLEGELAKLHKSIDKSKLKNSLYTITFSQSSSKGRHGDINEFIESILNGGKVRANVAVDLVTYTFGYKIERNKQLDEKIGQMTEQLSSIGDYLSTSKSTDERELTTVLNKVYDQLIQTGNEIEQALKDMGNSQKIYITHETLKLSTRAERGMEFHGRSMSIFSYISYLCSANLSSFNVGDETMLQFLAYNLIQGAAADDMVGPLEKYFSMFAGMLMFDDVQNMAIEAVDQVKPVVETRQAIQIHLYNLNGLYIPASMILMHVREELGNIREAAQTNLGAQAHISFNQNASPNNTPAQRAEAAKKTKVNITFLGGFTNLINNLFPG